jgi:hypothetical protein
VTGVPKVYERVIDPALESTVAEFALIAPLPISDRLRFTVVIEKVAVTEAAWFIVSVQVV